MGLLDNSNEKTAVILSEAKDHSNFSRSFASLRMTNRPHFIQNGFTLIEILIVIVIISIVSGIALLTLSRNQQKQYEYLAKSLAHLITLAEEEAMLRPATIGLAFTSNSYQFLTYQNTLNNNKTHWQALAEPPFGLHRFSPTIQLTIKVQDKTVPLDGQPHIIISASGDIPAFTILIGKQDQTPSYQVIGHADGNVTSGSYYEK